MRKRDNSRQGLAAVELALMLPVMALVLMLLVEGANAMHTYSTLLEASREGARHILMEGENANVEALVQALIADLDDQDLTTNVITDPVAKTVTVEISYDYTPICGSSTGGSIPGEDNDSFELVAQTTMPLP